MPRESSVGENESSLIALRPARHRRGALRGWLLSGGNPEAFIQGARFWLEIASRSPSELLNPGGELGLCRGDFERGSDRGRFAPRLKIWGYV